MESLFFMIPVAVVLLVIAVAVFIWAVKSDQFEDLDREGRRILFEDEAQAQASAVNRKEPPSHG